MSAAGSVPTITAHGSALAMVSRALRAVATAGGGRSVVVVGDDPELATALRDRLDRAYVTVLDAPGGEELEVIRACRPWPWMVVGAGAHCDPRAALELCRGLALVVWRPSPPSGLPAHAVTAGRFTEVAGTVATALSAEVGGMRLAIGSGVDMPDGAHVASPSLEAFIGSHPRPLVGSSRLMQSATRALAAHGVPLRPRFSAGGGAVLTPVDQP